MKGSTAQKLLSPGPQEAFIFTYGSILPDGTKKLTNGIYPHTEKYRIPKQDLPIIITVY